MKLLFDHNLSDKLVGRLADLFPDSQHVRSINLHEADDRKVWEYAQPMVLPLSRKMRISISSAFSIGHRPKSCGSD